MSDSPTGETIIPVRLHAGSPDVSELQESQADRVHAARIHAVFEQMPIALFVTLLNCCLVSLVLLEVVAWQYLLAWFLATALVTLVRFGLWGTYWKSAAASKRLNYWAAIATGGSLASGVLWGAGAGLMFPEQESYQLFLALVIAGMSAGVATVYSSDAPAVLAFLLPATLPLAGRFFFFGERLQIVAGVLTLIFAAAMAVAARRFDRWFGETVAARFSLEAGSRELNRANALLTTEIANHHATQDKLLQSQKIEAIGRLTAGIAHDFNNLLMAISGTADLIKLRLGPDDTRAVGLDTIHQATDRGAKLTSQLLSFARKQALTPQHVDLNDLIRNMQRLLDTTVGGGLTVTLRLGPEPVPALIDPLQIENAILNLVINARDATPGGGRLTIATAQAALPGPSLPADLRAGDYSVITITDTGSGMPEHIRVRAFEPFFTTKEPGQGSGLGLSQVYGVVRQSGGTTEIESAVGAGTTVRIYLPRSLAAGLPSTPAPVPDVAKSSGRPTTARILLLDDDAAVRSTTAALLDEAGYEVTAVASCDAALREIGCDREFRLMIVDYAMPDMRGDQFAQMARRRLPGVPVLFVTGYADAPPLSSERWLLTKPFRSTLLLDTVADAIETTRKIAGTPPTGC